MSVSVAQMQRIKNGIRMKFRVITNDLPKPLYSPAYDNPVAEAIKNQNRVVKFAAGVDVEEVIRFIAWELAQQELSLEKPPGKRAMGRR